MHSQDKIDCGKIEKGFEFPPAECDLDAEWVARYLEAVGNSGGSYAKQGLVPPMAAATYAMSSLGNMLSMPPGAIHVSQSFDFLAPLYTGDHIICYSRVAKRRSIGEMVLMSFEINIVKPDRETAVRGNMDVMLASTGE